jgi:hypothetical protein
LAQQMLEGLQAGFATCHHGARGEISERNHPAILSHGVGGLPSVAPDAGRRGDHSIAYPAQTDHRSI